MPKGFYGRFGDDIFNSRFDREFRKDFASSNSTGSFQKSSRPIPRLFFKGDFKRGATQSLAKLFSSLCHLAGNAEYREAGEKLRVVFIDPPHWKKLPFSDKHVTNRLPSLYSAVSGKTLTCYLITDPSDGSFQNSLNICRLLISKLFGDLFFEYHVERSSLFKELLERPNFIDVGSDVKLSIIRYFAYRDDELTDLWGKIGTRQGVKGEKSVKYGQSMFFHSALSPENTHWLEILNRKFEDFSKLRNRYIGSGGNQLIEKIFHENGLFRFILPHEKLRFQQMMDKNPSVFFRLISEKISYVHSVYRQLKEIADKLEKTEMAKSSGIDPEKSSQDGYHSIEQSRARTIRILDSFKDGLLQRRLAKAFLIERSFMTGELKTEFGFFKMKVFWGLKASGEKEPDKYAELVIDQYATSIYQKIYNASHSLRELVLGNDKALSEVRRHMSWVQVRGNKLIDLLNVCAYFGEYFNYSDKRLGEIRLSLSHARKGWSYFISYALISLYYLKYSKNKQHGTAKRKEFQKIIWNHFAVQAPKNPMYRFAGIFMNLFDKEKIELPLIRKILTHKCPVLLGCITDNFLSRRAGAVSGSYLTGMCRNIRLWLRDFMEHEKSAPKYIIGEATNAPNRPAVIDEEGA